MARDYGHRRPVRRGRSQPNLFLVVAVTFLLGYFTASFMDLEKLSHWVNSQLLAERTPKQEAPKAPPKTAQLPTQFRLWGHGTRIRVAGLFSQTPVRLKFLKGESTEVSYVRETIEKLNHAIGIPARLRDLGAKREQIPGFAEKALGIARLIRVNPRVPNLPDVVQLLNEAY